VYDSDKLNQLKNDLMLKHDVTQEDLDGQPKLEAKLVIKVEDL
jgi:hypothetical protein